MSQPFCGDAKTIATAPRTHFFLIRKRTFPGINQRNFSFGAASGSDGTISPRGRPGPFIFQNAAIKPFVTLATVFLIISERYAVAARMRGAVLACVRTASTSPSDVLGLPTD